MRALQKLVAGVAVVVASGAAQAALIDRGGGLIYDDVLKITWLADANYAKTSDYDADGKMNWSAAKTWADQLVYHDSVHNVDYSDWRLPTLNPSDTTCSKNYDPIYGGAKQYYGYNCTGSELSHLLVADLGNKQFQSVLITTGDTVEQIANLALFSNVQSVFPNGYYWSATDYAPPNPTDDAWAFNTADGSQYHYRETFEIYAWAVRPGDVAAAPSSNDVPEPSSLMLLGLGLALAGLGAARRRGRFGA